MHSRTGSLAALLFLSLLIPSTVHADEPYMGEVRLFASNYCPQGFMEAAGQVLPVGEHQALFSILGTTYGGDGRTTFALPDLRGRAPIGHGQGPGLEKVMQGRSQGGDKVKKDDATGASHTLPSLAMTYCIAIKGMYPPRP